MSREQVTRPGSGQMFDAIAHRYDLLNRLMSLGIDQLWRRRTVAALELPEKARVLDLATGTADLALQIASAHPDCTVVGLDPSREMLAIGRRKIAAQGLGARIELVEGDAQALPFAPASFDGITIAFGIRNVPDRAAALQEMARVVRPGGRVCVLELTEPRRGLLAPLARFHVHVVVPRLGAALSGSREYRYLQQSIAAFPAPDEFDELCRAAALDPVSRQRFALGACHLFVSRSAPEAS